MHWSLNAARNSAMSRPKNVLFFSVSYGKPDGAVMTAFCHVGGAFVGRGPEGDVQNTIRHGRGIVNGGCPAGGRGKTNPPGGGIAEYLSGFSGRQHDERLRIHPSPEKRHPF